MQAVLNNRLISDQIDTILATVLGKFLVQGSPTKHGGLRFLDIQSAKTFGFEKTREFDNGNLLLISAPASPDKGAKGNEPIEELKQATEQRLEAEMRKGPHVDRLHAVTVRPSPDPGKKRKMFLEVAYFIPTSELLTDAAIVAYAKEHGMTDTNEAVKRILREFIVPIAKETMDHLITVIRQEP
jgi:hypothetical protein